MDVFPMLDSRWRLLVCLSDVPSARILTDQLVAEGINPRVVTDAAVMGQAAPCRIFVDATQEYRARRLLTQEQLTESELTFLATGELTAEEDATPAGGAAPAPATGV
jgi:hypothetical protein